MRRPRVMAGSLLRLQNAAREADRLKALTAHVMMVMAEQRGDASARLRAIVRFLVHNPKHRRTAELVSVATRLAAHCAPTLRAASQNAEVLDRTIIAKRPRRDEKGVLIVSFEAELMKLCLSSRFQDIEQQYDLVFVPSWQPFYSSAFFMLLAVAKSPFWLMPSASADAQLCADIKGCRALPLKASSWVNPYVFRPLARARDIDLLMVANYEAYKRHWMLFEAVAQLPPTVKAVVAGLSIAARTKDTIMEEADVFGVRDRVQILDNVSDQLPAMMARSKLLCALSHREGSCIVVAEALMAGTAVGMYENASIGSKEFVNRETGVLFSRARSLAPQIRDFLPRATHLRPDLWARRHISCLVSSSRLSDALRRQSEADEFPWTEDLFPLFCQRLSFHYFDSAIEAEMLPTYNDFKFRFGLELRRPVTLPPQPAMHDAGLPR